MSDRHHHHHHHHWRDQGDYAHRAGEPGPGPNHHRLYRDKKNGMVAGVCAGLARYFGWSVGWTRVIFVILVIVFQLALPLLAYIAAAVLIKPGPGGPAFETREEEEFWRTFSTRPRVTFSELKHRFRALDVRIADLEKTVTSNEYGLRKAFRDLEGDA